MIEHLTGLRGPLVLDEAREEMVGDRNEERRVGGRLGALKRGAEFANRA